MAARSSSCSSARLRPGLFAGIIAGQFVLLLALYLLRGGGTDWVITGLGMGASAAACLLLLFGKQGRRGAR